MAVRAFASIKGHIVDETDSSRVLVAVRVSVLGTNPLTDPDSTFFFNAPAFDPAGVLASEVALRIAIRQEVQRRGYPFNVAQDSVVLR